MNLGRVVGRIWSTVKDEALGSQRLLVVQPVTPELEDTGRCLICSDGTGVAGAGEIIYWVRGREASFPFAPVQVPTDASIIAIVDEIHVKRGPKK